MKGKWRGKEVFILPSFSSVSLGYCLNDLEPKDFGIIGNKSLKNFEVVIYNEKEQKEYNFGKLKYLI